jgi:hypothetical protein
MDSNLLISGLLIYFLMWVFTLKRRYRINHDRNNRMIISLGESSYWSTIFIALLGMICFVCGWASYGLGSFLLFIGEALIVPIKLFFVFLSDMFLSL